MRSRQEQAFTLWSQNFIRLVSVSKDVPEKTAVLAHFEDMFNHPGVRSNMLQAFTNFMWDFDKKVESDVVSELRTILSLVQKVADPNNKNTKAIVAVIETLIAEDYQGVDEMSDEDIELELEGEDAENENDKSLL